MADMIKAFDPTQFDPSQGAGQLPIGRHLVKAVASEIKANKDNTGGYLQFTLRVEDGPIAGSTGPIRFNLYSSSPQAADIAHKQLSTMCHAVGRLNPIARSEELHDMVFMVEVGPQADPKYTEIKHIFDRNGNEPGKTPVQQQQPPQQQQPQGPQGGQAWGAPAQQQAPQQAPAQAWGAPPPQQQQPQAPQQWQQPPQQPAQSPQVINNPGPAWGQR